MIVKRVMRMALKGLKRWVQDDSETSMREAKPLAFENTYPWLAHMFRCCMQDRRCAQRPAHVWGALQGIAAAKALGMPRVSLIEFGVAYGAGALALERVADTLEALLAIGIDIYGFDTGRGLPKPQDYRDCPNLWSEGYYPLDPDELQERLQRTHLKLGMVESTVPAFVRSGPAPIAFISFDLDFYSSTTAALKVLDAGDDNLMPRVYCYFDDIIGFSFGDHNGQRLAIAEFNAGHGMRKLSPIYGLKYFVPPAQGNPMWMDGFYLAHLFHHPLYGEPDGSNRPRLIDIDGVVREAGPRR